MKRNVFEALKSADDNVTERLSSHLNASEDERGRVFAMSERKWKDMKDKSEFNERTEIGVELISVRQSPKWLTPIRTAAACLAVLVIGGTAFGILRTKQPKMSGAQNEESEKSIYDGAWYSTIDEAEKEIDDISVYEESSASSAAVSSDNEKSAESKAAKSEDDGVRCTVGEDDVQSGAQASSEIQSEHTTEREIDSNGSYIEQSPPNEIIEEPIENDTIDDSTDEENLYPAEDPAEEDVEPQRIGYTTSEKLMQIKSGMTYAQVFEILGEPERCGVTSGYAEYIVDDDKLIYMRYDYETDIVGVDGVMIPYGRLSDMFSDPDNRTFDGYIVDYNGESVRVTCPQYPKFDCATVSIHVGDNSQKWREIIDIALANNTPLRITYDGNVLETYPPIITAVNIEGYK